MSVRPNVIIADSNQDFLVYLSTLLGRMNFEVLPVGRAPEAFEIAKIVKPDLFFVGASADKDIGIKIVKDIRKDNLLSKTPIIVMGEEMNDLEDYFSAGCSDFITKPMGLTTLHLSLQKCLPNREGMRKHLRAPFNKKITFEFAGLEVESFAITLSEGGVYLRTNKPLPENSKVKVKIPLDSGDIILDGKVIYALGLVRGSFLIPPGMAIQFDEKQVGSKTMKALSEEVCRLLIGDIIDEQEEKVFECGKELND